MHVFYIFIYYINVNIFKLYTVYVCIYTCIVNIIIFTMQKIYILDAINHLTALIKNINSY